MMPKDWGLRRQEPAGLVFDPADEFSNWAPFQSGRLFTMDVFFRSRPIEEQRNGVDFNGWSWNTKCFRK